MATESSTDVVGLVKVTVVVWVSVTDFEYGDELSVPDMVIELTVADVHGLAITMVNSTLSLESAGANDVDPLEPLLLIEMLF